MNLVSTPIHKYPRTPHLEGSRLQKGDEDVAQVPYRHLRGRWIVVEEKMDGANAGLRFNQDANLCLQSRGHYLVGGSRERHFSIFRTWAHYHEEALFEALGDRYLMFGEWMAAKHTVYYDRLPHYFLEFDVWDTRSRVFLSTAARRRLLANAPVASVPVLYEGPAPDSLEELLSYVRPSLGKSLAWEESLRQEARRQGLDVGRVLRETERSRTAEGLYLKVEEGDETVERFKWVRADFLQALLEADGHWQSRPIVPNRLMEGVDLYADRVTPWPDPE